MKHTDFQRVFDMIDGLEESMTNFIETGLMLELELLKNGQLDPRDLSTYQRWREWLTGPQELRWHEAEKRYVAASLNQADFVRAELAFFLMNYAEYLAECENCGQFFVKTNRRPQRFCKRRDRACRDEYHTGKRKTPEGRKEWADYMRGLRARKRDLRKLREKKREREEQEYLDQILPDPKIEI